MKYRLTAFLELPDRVDVIDLHGTVVIEPIDRERPGGGLPTVLLNCEKGFRRIKGHADIPALVTALENYEQGTEELMQAAFLLLLTWAFYPLLDAEEGSYKGSTFFLKRFRNSSFFTKRPFTRVSPKRRKQSAKGCATVIP